MKIETEYKGVKLPAKMLVWDDNESDAVENYVLVYIPSVTLPFKSVALDGYIEAWEHAKPIPEKKMRLMTAQELKGKWLSDKVGNHFMVTSVNVALNQILLPDSGDSNEFVSVDTLNNLQYTLEDGSSLMVEVEGDV